MNDQDKKLLLKLARESIATYFSGGKPDLSPVKQFSDKLGCFVTLHEHGDLRGCIGYPYPTYPLFRAIIEGARAAAFSDPRFPPVTEDELKDIDIEISVLTEPKEMKVKRVEDYLSAIKIGRDGLIIKSGFQSGLLLPQVATENGFTARQFLNCLCQKAGLPFNAWRDHSIKIYSFQAEVFGEKAK